MMMHPLKNKVDPSGALQPVSARGTRMGNRGILHNEHGEVVHDWKTKSWVTCLLTSSLPKRVPFSPGQYSELFFLDEATSFSAGHRPCRFCQRDRFDEFKDRWLAANFANRSDQFTSIKDIDAALHLERVRPDRSKSTYPEEIERVPRGAMIHIAGSPYLVWYGGLKAWTYEGYNPCPLVPKKKIVEVLTPRSVVNVYSTGFRPFVHPSADA